jgi:serine/threonine-protein kinase
MLRSRQKIGKYKIQKRIAQGGFAQVYRAYDTVEGINVALKIPHPAMVAQGAMDDFLKEVRLTARLDHPNILPIKNANFIDNQFVIAYALGEATLADKMSSRLPLRSILDYCEQMLAAVAYAHRKRVVHCDLKPQNFIIFPGNKLKLADFGIARIGTRTLQASGSGTVGYLAPDQALGKPSRRSDVFSLGLIIYELITNKLPEWPFDWPPPGFERLKRKTHPEFIAFLKRAMIVDARKRYPSAVEMFKAFQRVKRRAGQSSQRRSTRRRQNNTATNWRHVRFKEFRRRFGKTLETHYECGKCGGPLAERMIACPWCGHRPKTFRGETSFPARCRDCKRGMKLDWHYCPHTYGPAQGPRSNRSFTDIRYVTTCSNSDCGQPLMPFLKYCPWCRTKVRRKWKIPGEKHKCPKCGWGIIRDFWNFCPWCTHKLIK